MNLEKAAEVLRIARDDCNFWLSGRGHTELGAGKIKQEMEALTYFISLAERMNKDNIVKIQLPYPATFTEANPDGRVNNITLSYESTQAILNYLTGEK